MGTVVGRLGRQAAERPHAPAYFSRRHGAWQPTSWSDYHRQVRRRPGLCSAPASGRATRPP
jgi:hypothetical protein